MFYFFEFKAIFSKCLLSTETLLNLTKKLFLFDYYYLHLQNKSSILERERERESRVGEPFLAQ